MINNNEVGAPPVQAPVVETPVETTEVKVAPVVRPMSFITREPVAIAAALRAVLYVAVLFGFDMSPEQMTGIVVAVESVLMLLTRQQVTPFVPSGTNPTLPVPEQDKLNT